MDKEELKRFKSKQLRYKKPIVRDLNLDSIQRRLWEMQEECENVKWFCDDDEESLINSLIGNEDEAYEFKMMFCDLSAECERFAEDLCETYITEYFDDFLAAFSGNDFGGGLYGWDSYEGDYLPLGSSFEYSAAEEETSKRLMRLTKREMMEGAIQCFHVAMNYISLENRYDNLKSSMDILKDENTCYLKTVKKINEIYEKANADNFYDWYPSVKEYNQLIDEMPQEVWLQ